MPKEKVDRLADYRRTGDSRDLPEWLTTDEVAELIAKSRSSVIDSINAGQIKAKMHGRYYRIHRDEIVPPVFITSEKRPLVDRFRDISVAMSQAGAAPELIGATLGYYAAMTREREA